MIIGLSGYAGSGKDTAGIMIQWASCYNTHGVTMNEVLRKYHYHQHWMEGQSGWAVKKFSGKLKQIAGCLLGVDDHEFEASEFKKENLGPEWGSMSVRTFLQRLGTDAIRDGLHQDAWLNALWVDYTDYSKWIVTDVRFPNEAQSIKDRGGIIVRVNRPSIGRINDHISETALDNWVFDYTLENNEGLEALLLAVCQMLKKYDLYASHKTKD